jgi:uncharacterized membrane protein YccF (DUF307 family)
LRARWFASITGAAGERVVRDAALARSAEMHMSLILNLIWFVCGGFVMAIGWLAFALLMAITVVGLPWARACLNIAIYTLWPFGKDAINRKILTGEDDLGTGGLGVVGNILWFIFAGLWLCIGHVAAAIASALTVIGIPLAVAHLKLANVALFPVGKTIVSKEVAEQARRRAAQQQLGAA